MICHATPDADTDADTPAIDFTLTYAIDTPCRRRYAWHNVTGEESYRNDDVGQRQQVTPPLMPCHVSPRYALQQMLP